MTICNILSDNPYGFKRKTMAFQKAVFQRVKDRLLHTKR